MLQKFKDALSEKTLKIVIIITLIIFTILTIIFQLQNTTLQIASGYGILDFEFAFNEATAIIILAAWGPALRLLVLQGTYLDFLYIISYGLLIMSLNLLLARKLKERWQTVGVLCALAPIIAGLFDVIENVNLIIMLNNPTNFSSIAPLLASICATLKFGFLLLGIGFSLIAILKLFIDKRRAE